MKPHNPNSFFNLNPISRRQCLGLAGAGLLASTGSWAQDTTASTLWAAIEKEARGQTVRFNAWAGSERINAYVQWAGTELQRLHGVRLEHVKINDAADVVRRVRSEKAAGRSGAQGSVDLVWINGENFAAMKRDGLLFGPFAEALPNFRLVDTEGKPSTRLDFSTPTEGLESPWGMAQLTFFADEKALPNPPQNMQELLALARRQTGRISYPRPPDFHGTTFVKQALLETASDPAQLTRPANAEAFAKQSAGLWAFLDALHPQLWRGGKQFPQSAAAIRQMMADRELLMALTFNPNEAANEIAAKRLPASVKSWQFKSGTIGNTHFVAIPFNAPHKAAAQVAANFLLSVPAQARKADIAQWGDPTVLSLAKLTPAERALFTASAQAGQVTQTAPVLPEPHASWVELLEKEWVRRYGV